MKFACLFLLHKSSGDYLNGTINVKIIVMPMEINISMHDDQQEVQPCNEICIF